MGSGRHTLAGLLSRAMVCTHSGEGRPCEVCAPCRKAAGGIHPDVITVAGEDGKPISVDQVRKLRTDAYIRPNEAQRKIYLLERADRMNQSAQNAMLKLLEEGPAYAVFLLLAENSGGLLETIRSRCELLTMTPLTPDECEGWLREKYPQQSPQTLRQAAFDCQGILGYAVARLDGTGAFSAAVEELALQLALAMEKGDELELFQTAMSLEKLSREELAGVLERTVVEVVRILPKSNRKQRLLRGVELLRTLRGAAELNVGAGQLGGWLCAGVMSE